MKLRFPVEQPKEDESEGQWRPFGVGIDVHKEMVWACVLAAEFSQKQQKRYVCKFETSLSGLNNMRLWLENLVPREEQHFLLEATSTYHFPVMLALPGWIPTVINPKTVGSAKRKTDRWDAQKLAHHDMMGTFPPYILPTENEQALRIIMRRLIKVKRTISRNTQAIKSRLCYYGVTGYGSTDTKIGEEIFTALALGRDPPDHRNDPDTRLQLEGLVQLSRRIPHCVRRINHEQLVEIAALRRQWEDLWVIANETVEPRCLMLLRTVPHVNDTTILTFCSEVGYRPLRRFASIRSIVAYAGFDPSKRVSADSVTSFLPGVGNKFLRRTFLQAASGAVLAKNSELARYGQSIIARYGKKGWFAGVNAVGRKLVRYCASVLINNTPFTEGLWHGKAEGQRVLSRISGTVIDPDPGFTAPACWDGSITPETGWEECEGRLGDFPG